jgi:hypothetical protein
MWPTRGVALAEARRRVGESWYRRGVATLASFDRPEREEGLFKQVQVSECANRPDFVRILYQVRFEMEGIPGPTAWAYFDVGMGWTEEGKFGGDFAALVKTWAAELQNIRMARGRRT